MRLKDESVRYLTKAEIEAAREEEHRERVELQRRVERGEITAAEANREASIFHPEVFDAANSRPANFEEEVQNILKLRPRKRHERRKQKAIRY